MRPLAACLVVLAFACSDDNKVKLGTEAPFRVGELWHLEAESSYRSVLRFGNETETTSFDVAEKSERRILAVEDGEPTRYELRIHQYNSTSLQNGREKNLACQGCLEVPYIVSKSGDATSFVRRDGEPIKAVDREVVDQLVGNAGGAHPLLSIFDGEIRLGHTYELSVQDVAKAMGRESPYIPTSGTARFVRGTSDGLVKATIVLQVREPLRAEASAYFLTEVNGELEAEVATRQTRNATIRLDGKAAGEIAGAPVSGEKTMSMTLSARREP